MRLVFPVTAFALLVGCSTTVENPQGQPGPTNRPDREAADRVLNTMREKVAAAEELVQIREETVRGLEALLAEGVQSSTAVATARAQLWEARIRALNYKQEIYIAEAAMPLIMQTMRDKVAAAEKVLEIREELGGETQTRTQALAEAGRDIDEDLASIRRRILEDRIRVLNYRQELYTAEAVFGMVPGMATKPGDAK